jgi:hypothetical protein
MGRDCALSDELPQPFLTRRTRAERSTATPVMYQMMRWCVIEGIVKQKGGERLEEERLEEGRLPHRTPACVG